MERKNYESNHIHSGENFYFRGSDKLIDGPLVLEKLGTPSVSEASSILSAVYFNGKGAVSFGGVPKWLRIDSLLS